MPTKPRIVVTRRMPEEAMARIDSDFDAVVLSSEPLIDRVIAAVADHEAMGIVLTSDVRLDAGALAAMPEHLKVIATASVGFDHIDLGAAAERGIIVANTPDVVNDATADMAFLLILAACRRASEYGALMREGWDRSLGMHEMLGIEVSGKTLGLIGMGRIGQAVARRARGFGMKILYHNRTRLDAEREGGATWYAELDQMLPHCDILSLHAPGGAETADIINARTLALLPAGAVLVNTARGSLVDEEALVAALESGRLFAAGLDVFKNEPRPDRRLLDLPNVFSTPHTGSATRETRAGIVYRCLDNISAIASGRPAPDALTGR